VTAGIYFLCIFRKLLVRESKIVDLTLNEFCLVSVFSHGGPAILVGFGVLLLYIAAGLAIWSFVVYMRKIWKVLLR
jgi:hypothetical protein